MAERKQKVETFSVKYDCDECGKPMKYTGIALMSMPPQYPHECSNGHKITLKIEYPHIEYKYTVVDADLNELVDKNKVPDDLSPGDILIYKGKTLHPYTNGKEYKVISKIVIPNDHPYSLNDDTPILHRWSLKAIKDNFLFVGRPQ